MTDSNTVLLYVSDPAASARFYGALLGRQPVEQSPTFAMFVLPSGLGLGLWKRDGVEPAATAPTGGSELAFRVADAARVDALHAEWGGKKVAIALPPTDLDFGHTFVALDPDGHRLRVFALAEEG